MLILQEQIAGLLLMSLLGVFGAIAFDGYRCLRQIVGLKKTGTLIGDILYSLGFLLVFLIFLMSVNQGQLRSYVYLGLILGYSFYFGVVHRFLGRIIYHFVYFVVMVFDMLAKIMTFPFRMVGKIIVFPLIKGITILKGRIAAGLEKQLFERKNNPENVENDLE